MGRVFKNYRDLRVPSTVLQRRQWHPTPVLWPGKSMDEGAWLAAVHGVAKSRERLSDFTFTFHFSLSCIGEGNGNPLQCSCLENLRDGGAWWAAVYGVAQSQTRLTRLSSSSSSSSTVLQVCIRKKKIPVPIVSIGERTAL